MAEVGTLMPEPGIGPDIRSVIRYRPFGLFRLVLAAFVYISHSWHWTFEHPEQHFIASVNIGPLSVLAFFVLSAYVISEGIDRFYRGRPVNFMVNRLLRLFPQYWWALAISIALHAFCYYALDGRTVPAEVFDGRNILTNISGIIPVVNFQRLFDYQDRTIWFVAFTWAVAVELVFYTGIFLVFLLFEHLDRIPSRLRLFARTHYATAVVVALLAVNVAFARGGGAGVDRYTQFIPYFLFGCLIYHLAVQPAALRAAGAALCGALMFRHCVGFVTEGTNVSDAVKSADLVVFAVMLLVFLVLSRLGASSWFKVVDKKAGDLSYPLYLNQWAVIVFFDTFALGWRYSGARLQLLGLVTVGLIALLANRVVEAQIGSIRQRLRGARL